MIITNELGQKQCNKCLIFKDLNDFHKAKISIDGRRNNCKECRLIETKGYTDTITIINIPEDLIIICRECKISKNQSEYLREKNKRGISSLCKLCDNERQRKNRKKNKESLSFIPKVRKTRASKILTLEEIEAKKLRIAGYKIKYKKSERGKLITTKAQHYRRDKEKNLPCTLTVEEWGWILQYQENKCGKCNREFSEVLKATKDHIIPVSKGGGLCFDNVQALCASCNSSKHDNIEDFRPMHLRSLFCRAADFEYVE